MQEELSVPSFMEITFRALHVLQQWYLPKKHMTLQKYMEKSGIKNTLIDFFKLNLNLNLIGHLRKEWISKLFSLESVDKSNRKKNKETNPHKE